MTIRMRRIAEQRKAERAEVCFICPKHHAKEFMGAIIEIAPEVFECFKNKRRVAGL